MLYICRECGAENAVYKYVEFIDCYACGTRLRSGKEWKAECRKKFSGGAGYKFEENVYQNEIFQSLNLSNDESKYIIVEKDTVYFVIPIKIEIKISIGNKRLQFDNEAEAGLFENICNFFNAELYKGGFTLNRINSHGKLYQNVLIGKAEFFKDTNTDNEAKEAVKWLVDFKKRVGF
ncbi:MAG: hypothetical protein AABY79_00280 [Nitrospirota bacterium]